MIEANSFTHSDLAFEKRTVLPNTDDAWQREHGIEYEEKTEDGIGIATLEVTSDEGAELLGKPRGKYITVFCGKLRSLEAWELERLQRLVAKYIRTLTCSLLGHELTEDTGVLVVGLGNRQITSDAIGPKTADKMIVTRHIRHADGEVWRELGMCEVSALAPGVLGQTGIETVELVRGAVKNVSPSLVIVIDALAARSCDRLAATVQLSDTGIEPGSGIGNRRKAIDKKTLGIPVLSIGVPTVVASSTLVYDALSSAGISDISEELRGVLENGRGFFVSPGDADVICEEMTDLLAGSIDTAMSV